MEKLTPVSSKPQTRSPKYIELAERLRSQVRTGRLAPGDRLPSFVELRNEHGISRGTVEKAHALLEQEGLIFREQGRGVFVASTSRHAPTGVIGFVGAGFGETQSSLYWARIMSGMQQEAMHGKVQFMLLLDTTDAGVWEKVDGVVLSQNEEDLYGTICALPKWMPRVVILAPTDRIGMEVSSVQADDYQGMRDATRHLISLGHRRIAFVTSGGGRLIELRMEGYKDALQESGIEPGLRWLRPLRMRLAKNNSKSEFIEQGRRTMCEWLAGDWKELGCTALLAQNDNAAIGAIEALQEAGLDVPGDVSVVGFDGTEMYDYFSPKLTTVRVPVREIGASGVRLLLQQIERGAGTSNIVLPTELRIGSSTGPAFQSRQ